MNVAVTMLLFCENCNFASGVSTVSKVPGMLLVQCHNPLFKLRKSSLVTAIGQVLLHLAV